MNTNINNFVKTKNILKKKIDIKESNLEIKKKNIKKKLSIKKAILKDNIQKYKNKKYQESLNNNPELKIKSNNSIEKVKEKIYSKKILKNNINQNINIKINSIIENINNIDDINLKKKRLKELFGNIIIRNLENKKNNNFFNYINRKKTFLTKKSLNINFINKKLNLISHLPQNIDIDLFTYFGLDKLTNYSLEDKNIIFKNILDYSIDINTKLFNIDYLNKDIYMLKITDILIKKNFSNIYPKNKLIGQGSWGKVYEHSNKMYKFEHLRYRDSLNGFKKREIYGPLSYVPSIILVSYIIENYIYKLNEEYVPKIYNLNFSFTNNLGVTIMNKAFNNEYNKSLYYFLLNEKDKSTFIINFYEILYNICNILEFYQNKCNFVHYDLHLNNILINYSYLNNLFSFKLKLIDFGLSSIVFFDNNNKKYKLLKYINLKKHKNPDIVNPLKSTLWNRLDLLYFITFLLLNYYIINQPTKENDKESIKELSDNYIRTSNIIKLNNIICQIFDIDLNYMENFDNITNNGKNIPNIKKVFYILQNKSFREKIYGSNFNMDICDPTKLKSFLEKQEIIDLFNN